MGQFRNIKEVRRQPAHQLPGAIAVKIVKGQLLHVAKQIPADICFHQDAEGMPPISNDVGKDRPQGKGRKHHSHDRKEGFICVLGQQLIHAPTGNIGKRQVNQGDHQGAGQIHDKQPPVGPEIGKENLKLRLFLKITGCHIHTPCSHRYNYT